jgi:hypothetical protein
MRWVNSQTILLVFDDQYRFDTARANRLGHDLDCAGRRFGGGEQRGQRRAAPRLRLEIRVATRLVDDAVDRGETQTRARAIRLGREERLEGSFLASIHRLVGGGAVRVSA